MRGSDFDGPDGERVCQGVVEQIRPADGHVERLVNTASDGKENDRCDERSHDHSSGEESTPSATGQDFEYGPLVACALRGAPPETLTDAVPQAYAWSVSIELAVSAKSSSVGQRPRRQLRRDLVAVIALTSAFVAGCSLPADEHSSEAASDAPAVRVFDGTFEMTILQIATAGSGENCIVFDSSIVITRMTATADWEPRSALDQMQVAILLSNSTEDFFIVEGRYSASPATLDVAGLPPARESVSTWAQPPEASVAATDFTLTLQAEYHSESADDPSPQRGSCGGSAD